MRHSRRCIMILLMALLLPGEAMAQLATLTCVGPIPTGSLYNVTAVCSNLAGLQTIFSGMVCNFETLLNAIMGSVYCGIQYALTPPLEAALIIYVILYGIQLTMGYTSAHPGEVVMHLMKIVLVWVFATDSTWGIGLVYNFFVTTADAGIGWVLGALPLPTPAPGTCVVAGFNLLTNPSAPAFSYMDYLICSTLTGPFSAQGAMLAGFFGVLAIMIPPVFMMFSYFFTKSLVICARCLIAYLLAISSIAFLVCLSPIFLSLALFSFTRQFFEDWLKFLISFTLQIIFIFAGFALWVSVMVQLGSFFSDLATMVRPVQQTPQALGLRFPTNTWGLCQFQLAQTFWGPYLTCVDQPAPQGSICRANGTICWPAGGLMGGGLPGAACVGNRITGANQYCPAALMPSDLTQYPSFIFFLVLNLLTMCTVVYVFDALMGMLPKLAKQLAGSAYAPQIGGAGGHSGLGFGGLGNAVNNNRSSASGNFTQRLQSLIGGR